MKPETLRLGAWRVLAVEGPDAADFLHRLTTRDIKTIEAGGGAHAAWLDPKGRVLSLFVVARLDTERFRLIVPKDIFEKTKALADKYHFTEKLSITESEEEAFLVVGEGQKGKIPLSPPLIKGETVCSEVSVAERFPPLEKGEGPGLAGDRGIYWHWRDSLFGETSVHWALAEKGRAPSLPAMSGEAWESLRIAGTFPEYGRDVDETTVALEAVAFAVSRGKGCYPGQEIVERIFTQGSPARRLAVIEIDGSVAPGAAILSEGRKVGVVTSVAPPLALAYLQKGFWNGEAPLATEGGAGVRIK